MRSWHSPAGAESAPVPLPAPLPMPGSGRAVLPRANVTALTPCGGVRCGPRPGRTLGSGWEPPPCPCSWEILLCGVVWASGVRHRVSPLVSVSQCDFYSKCLSCYSVAEENQHLQPAPCLCPSSRGSSKAGLHRLKPFAFVPSSLRMRH